MSVDGAGDFSFAERRRSKEMLAIFKGSRRFDQEISARNKQELDALGDHERELTKMQALINSGNRVALNNALSNPNYSVFLEQCASQVVGFLKDDTDLTIKNLVESNELIQRGLQDTALSTSPKLKRR